MTLTEKIKLLCLEKKITFAELERIVGISNGQIRRWDTSSPKVENVQKIADYFGVSTDYLLDRTDDKYLHLDEEEQEQEIRLIHRAAKEMTPEQRKKALGLWRIAFDELFSEDEG